MSNKQLELAANIGLLVSVVLYILWRFLPYSMAMIAAYAGIVVSFITAALAVVMIVKKTDGKGFTLHKLVLMIPLLWFLMQAVAF